MELRPLDDVAHVVAQERSLESAEVRRLPLASVPLDALDEILVGGAD